MGYLLNSVALFLSYRCCILYLIVVLGCFVNVYCFCCLLVWLFYCDGWYLRFGYYVCFGFD